MSIFMECENFNKTNKQKAIYVLKKVTYYILNKPSHLLYKLCVFCAPIIPDRKMIEIVFNHNMNYKLNLNNPQTFNEKLQWLKLDSLKHPEYTQMVDKIGAKEYVSSIIGEEYVIPTIGIWNDVDDIEWEKLPEQFVIKATCDSGGVVVCKNKNILDVKEAKAKLSKLGGRDYTLISKEYPYKNVPHRFIAEEYLVDESGIELKDYKIFCFDGVAKFLFVATGRQNNDVRFDFFDTDFKHLPIINGHPNADVCPIKPKNYDKMIEIACELSKGIPHVRVDLYNVNGKIYFGELTFFHWSGIVPFEPMEWDYKFGEYIKLPIE